MTDEEDRGISNGMALFSELEYQLKGEGKRWQLRFNGNGLLLTVAQV